MASIVVFAACLAAIRGNYRARLYRGMAIVKVLPIADHTPVGMAAHARRMVSPENLRRASLDPRLSGLHQPLRTQVHARAESVEDGTLRVGSVAERSAAEARSIALAVADAYIADQGASRVVPWTAGIPAGSVIHPLSLSEPWELATALALAVLTSALVRVVPTAWVSKRRQNRRTILGIVAFRWER